MRLYRAIAWLLVTSCLLLASPGAEASRCLAFVQQAPRVHPAAFIPAVESPEVEITYVGHSTFRLTTPAGIVIATDYAGYAGPGPLPNVVTMNHAHETHFTNFPDPQIPHVLRGWNPEGGGVSHNLTLEDVTIRNVATDIRSWQGGVERLGNSIFIFEVADLCIGHLGHLHHKPRPEQYALIGRLDVVFAPVDGGLTLDLPTMIEVLHDLRASLVIPMHFFGPQSLARFLDGMRRSFDIAFNESVTTRVSLAELPRRPTVLVLSP